MYIDVAAHRDRPRAAGRDHRGRPGAPQVVQRGLEPGRELVVGFRRVSQRVRHPAAGPVADFLPRRSRQFQFLQRGVQAKPGRDEIMEAVEFGINDEIDVTVKLSTNPACLGHGPRDQVADDDLKTTDHVRLLSLVPFIMQGTHYPAGPGEDTRPSAGKRPVPGADRRDAAPAGPGLAWVR